MIKVIGHRGSAGTALENTLRSFEAALAVGVDMVEADIQKTKDGHFVVFHDNIIDRITNGTGFLENFTLDELKKFKLKDKSKILQLKDLCLFCKANEVPLFAESKSESIAIELYKFISNFLKNDQYIIGSFFHKQIYDLKKKFPASQVGIIFESYPINIAKYIKQVNADYVSIGFESATDSLVTEIKSTKKQLLFWTVDVDIEIKKAIAYEPFGIISNYPGRVRAFIQ